MQDSPYLSEQSLITTEMLGNSIAMTIAEHPLNYHELLSRAGDRWPTGKAKRQFAILQLRDNCGEQMSMGFFVAGTNRKCYKTTLCGLSWDRCLSSEATRFAVYDCTPTTCQKPCFAAGELREGCGNKGFEGLPCFQNSKIGCWPRVGMQAPFPCIPQDLSLIHI